jgi:carbon dioxide concentrating mechanism protein CcmN
MGVVLSASGGDIEVHLGAILGTGVLIVGASVIGDHACIGATTTVFNASVAPQVMVPTNSLLGDTSRQISPEIVEEPEIPVQEVEEVEEVKKSPVVGQVYINQMLLTLFPERQQKRGK